MLTNDFLLSRKSGNLPPQPMEVMVSREGIPDPQPPSKGNVACAAPVASKPAAGRQVR